ncbi:RNA helicase required for poly(A+) mRNA export [Blastocladiella emersonii ATCC 22665]|nr:RNA helicase required for poly(A+) mRNA export [Blastocladiella emersonii ATCC 22665]
MAPASPKAAASPAPAAKPDPVLAAVAAKVNEAEAKAEAKPEAATEEAAAADAAEESSDEEEEEDDEAAGSGAPALGPGLHEDFSTDEIVVTLANGSTGPIEVAHKFEDLSLPEPLLKGIYDANFNAPSVIQKKALPLLLKNPPVNMIAQSRSGTGKTAAFVLTMLTRINTQQRAPQAICLANTRELAIQIVEVVKLLGVHTGATVCMAVKDGVARGQRVTDPIVVGTPGTLVDLIRRKQLDVSAIKVMVLDEADAMLDQQNLGEQSRMLRKFVRNDVQVLLFSATFPDKVKSFAASFAPGANLLMLPRDEVNVKAIHQFYVDIASPAEKFQKLSDLYGLLTVGQSIIFVQRKVTARDVAKRMTDEGHAVSVITGEDEPSVRDQTMDAFRSGRAKVLIATNVLARGIDVPQVNLVVNYDMPVDQNNRPDHEAYMHRIGRTGRFGREGVSVNFIDSPQARDVQNLVIRQYSLTIEGMPDDFDEMEKMLKKCRI